MMLGCAESPASFEGRLVELLGSELPEGSTLLAASSMPIRELDSFLGAGERALRVMSNRGVNGIDGLVSTAFGIASVVTGPMVALLGDLAFLHDVGGLAAVARNGARGTIVVINNGGGGIFDYLPGAQTGAPIDEYFVAEHRHAFHGAAELYGLDYHAPASPEDLARLLRRSCRRKARLIELVVDRGSSLAFHKALWAAAGQAAAVALAELGGPD
jgi:2-succinyl-5-enolpyruvyl-6-hydroxy-3-cyclohexene-1-carboxylate synthase